MEPYDSNVSVSMRENSSLCVDDSQRVSRRIDLWIIRITKTLLCIMGLSLPIMISIEVGFRYVLKYSLFVVDSIALFMLVWLFMLGAGLALRQHAHVGVEFLVNRLPPAAGRVAFILSQALLFVFLLVMFCSGCSALKSASRQMEGVLGIRLLWVMLSFPIGFLLLMYHQVFMIIDGIRNSAKRGLEMS
jgi:TRAP-type C4-dicarboxylate transport system permease small subunit